MDKIVTSDLTISCDGGDYEGHPRVFLDLEKTGSALCPYCSCEFVLDQSSH